jgi:hypothetical protein
MITLGMAAAVFARALGDADALEGSGLGARLSTAIAAHIAAERKERRHG